MIFLKTDIGSAYYPHLAIDLAYSHSRATCGIIYKGIAEPIELQFGITISAVPQWINQNSPGVVTFVAAIRFLQILQRRVSKNVSVSLAEAFLSFKKYPSSYASDYFQSILGYSPKGNKGRDGTNQRLHRGGPECLCFP